MGPLADQPSTRTDARSRGKAKAWPKRPLSACARLNVSRPGTLSSEAYEATPVHRGTCHNGTIAAACPRAANSEAATARIYWFKHSLCYELLDRRLYKATR